MNDYRESLSGLELLKGRSDQLQHAFTRDDMGLAALVLTASCALVGLRTWVLPFVDWLGAGLLAFL